MIFTGNKAKNVGRCRSLSKTYRRYRCCTLILLHCSCDDVDIVTAIFLSVVVSPKIYTRHRCVAIGFQFSDTTIMFPIVSLPYGFENALHEVWESPIKRQHHNRKTISLPNLDDYQSNWHIQPNELTMRLYKRRSCTDSFARPVISLEHRPSY